MINPGYILCRASAKSRKRMQYFYYASRTPSPFQSQFYFLAAVQFTSCLSKIYHLVSLQYLVVVRLGFSYGSLQFR